MKKKRLIEIIPDYLTDGIFAKLDALGMPWTGEVGSSVLDFTYFNNHSGRKLPAPMLYNSLDEEGILKDGVLETVAEFIKFKYLNNWTKLWDALTEDYDALANHSMEETESIRDNTGMTKTGTVQNSSTDNGTREIEQTSSSDGSSEGGTLNKVFGLNSTTGKDASSASTNASNRATTTGSGTETLTNEQYTTTTNNLSDNITKTGERTRTVKGLSGFYTPQTMLSNEIELRRFNIFEKIFSDIDREITLSIY